MGAAVSKAGKAIKRRVRGFITGVRDLVNSLRHRFGAWLVGRVERPTKEDVRKAEPVIRNADDPTKTGQYITAKRERSRIDATADEVAKDLSARDKKSADDFLRQVERETGV